LNEITKNLLQEALFFRKTPQIGISSQNTLLSNLSTLQPIITSGLPIDSARQVEEHRYLKNVQIAF
jgi:hypothetical protein